MGKKEKKNMNFKITITLMLQKYKSKNYQYSSCNISSYPTFSSSLANTKQFFWTYHIQGFASRL